MLNRVTCDKILNSDIHKMWGAERIVRFQFETVYPIVPVELFLDSVKMVFDLKELPENLGDLIPAYKSKWPNPLTLKEILAYLPKKFYMGRVK
jgi:hypothetical protein